MIHSSYVTGHEPSAPCEVRPVLFCQPLRSHAILAELSRSLISRESCTETLPLARRRRLHDFASPQDRLVSANRSVGGNRQ
jgi:hypothetical protein